MDQLRADWQQVGPTSTPSLDTLKKRLRRRWAMAALEFLALALVAGLLAWSLTWLSGAMEWIYWGFFAAVFVMAAIYSVRLRVQARWRVDESASAVLDHARRDARMRMRAGRMAFWMSALILVFVMIWMLIAAWLDPAPIGPFLRSRAGALVFAALWCGMGMAIGAFIREKGQRQLLELDCIESEFEQ